MKLQIGDKVPDFTTTAAVKGADGRVQTVSWTLSQEAQKVASAAGILPG